MAKPGMNFGTLSRLVGATVEEVELERSGDWLRLRVNGIDQFIVPCGDCCSITWIENLSDEEALKGQILEVRERDAPFRGNVGTEKHREVDRVSYYEVIIRTDKGSCTIDFRNDSNGYYGGWIKLQRQLGPDRTE